MRQPIGPLTAIVAGNLLLSMLPTVAAADDTKEKASKKKDNPSVSAPSKTKETSSKSADEVPTFNILDAMKKGLVGVQAEGTGDGRMTMSVTNRTNRTLRVVLPPGIVAQGATGQMGGMGGGMGGMGGGGMGGGGMGGGGMGGRGGGGGMGGMGGMGRSSGTMPPMMGLMTLSRIIMYFCGDYASWDMRSLMMGMGGGGMMGGMGGGGMGGMGGGMGGGMRSVPPTDLLFADLKPKQTRNLPTSLVSLSPPNPDSGLALPEQGEVLRIVGDIAQINDNPRVQKALRRLSTYKAPASVSQLVMWRLVGGMEWDTIGQLADRWANLHEMALAKDFVARLDTLPDGESGKILFEIVGSDPAGEAKAVAIGAALKDKMVLGLQATLGIPAQPESPAVACRVRLSGAEALVQVISSDSALRTWVPYGKFTLPVVKGQEKADTDRFADVLTEEVLNRLVRAQLTKGPRVKGKLTYQLRIENASPLILNGLSVVGPPSKTAEEPKVLMGISIPPRKNLTVPASEEAVKALGLKQGIRVMALDLSGL